MLDRHSNMKQLLLVLILFISGFSMAQQTEYVDFLSADANIAIDATEKKVFGHVKFTFDVLKDVDSIYLDAVKTEFKNIGLTGLGAQAEAEYIELNTRVTEDHIIIYTDFKKDERFELRFDYSTKPKKALYFVKKEGDIQVWTQGQGKYTSNWLPSLDDTNDKIEFDFSITFDKDYEVLSNGKLTEKHINESTTTWYYDMANPMSSYLAALVIGKYDIQV